MMNDWHDTGWGPGRWIVVGSMMLAFWGLLVFLVVYVVRTVGHRDTSQITPGGAPEQAMRILDERFARGEIDADEYNQRRELLRSR